MMELDTKKLENHYVVCDIYGKWYGLGMQLDLSGAIDLKTAMEHANAVGYVKAQLDMRKALGLK